MLNFFSSKINPPQPENSNLQPPFHKLNDDEYSATTPIDDEPYSSSESQDSQNGKTNAAWGRLISEDPKFGHVDLITQEVTIGRRKDCTLTISDPRISGYHCKLVRDKTTSEVSIEDTSSNGTFLNNKRLVRNQIYLLKKGDELSLVAERGSPDCVVIYLFQDLSEKQDFEQLEGEINKYYEAPKILGSGNFSIVKLGINRKTGTKCAIKIINKKKYWNTNNLEQIEREVDILKKIQHPNIISIIDIYSTPRFLYIVLELATGGELFQKIVDKGAYSEKQARNIFKQMLSAVAYLHQNGIVHRDLKPENILLEGSGKNTLVKITDFGLAKIVGEQEMMTTLCGTPQYVAPEIILQSQYSSQDATGYGKQVDVWSLGAILYVLLSGTPPFDEERGNLFKQITKGLYEFPEEFWRPISPEAKDLVRKMLTVEPEQRITVEEALNHPWVMNCQGGQELQTVKKNLRNHHKSALSPIKVPNQHSDSDTDEERFLKRKAQELSLSDNNNNDDEKRKVSKKLFM